MRSLLCVLLLTTGLIPLPPALAAEEQPGAYPSLAEWWEGEGLLAPGAGPLKSLKAEGLELGGKYYGALFGIQNSAGGAASPWDDGGQLNLSLNAGRLLQIPALQKLKFNLQGRWREPSVNADPNTYVAGNSMFDPSNWASGTGWRFLQANAEFSDSLGSSSPNLLWLKGGWVQPRYEFALQPLSDKFLNNAVNSAKGIGGNIPFSSSFSTWGAMAQLNPDPSMALKAGLFMAYPTATASSNHGLWFEGDVNSNQNSTMAMVEFSLRPQINNGRLPGRITLGGYSYNNVTSRSAAKSNANYGLQTGAYLQVDQQLSREGNDKPGSEIQGLSSFNMLMLAPEENNQFPLYFHTGLNYTGLIPGRDNDALVASIAYGAYSPYNPGPVKTSTVFLEGGYHIALNRWLDLYPFVQWSVRPNGSSSLADAMVLGFGTSVKF
jgi:porin